MSPDGLASLLGDLCLGDWDIGGGGGGVEGLIIWGCGGVEGRLISAGGEGAGGDGAEGIMI